MAFDLPTGDMIQKDSSILVKVEQALTDLIVVSYIVEDKKYEGVLLETQKSNLPYGVYNLHPAFGNAKNATENKDDNLYSVTQRFAYQHDSTSNAEHYARKNVTKSKPQKMTVRLRPRKVLCSNCQGICNESNENVDLSRKRKAEAVDDNATETNVDSNSNNDVKKKFLMRKTLIPKLSRLDPQEISNAIKGSSKGRQAAHKASDETLINDRENRVREELTFVNVADNFDNTLHNAKTDNIESYKDQGDKEFNAIYSSARTLKICYGAGEGTVVKIPPIGDFNDDSGVSCDVANKLDDRAVKKALKRARRQRKKDIQIYQTLSPKHIGALSPRNNVTDNQPNIDLQKKHKHKLKHKRKCKPKTEEGDENTSKTADEESIDYFSGIKKLSISLRRLSSNAYERREDDGSESWESEIVPEFPPLSNEGLGKEPMHVSPGDVVWGKVVGFPWWPGRVLNVASNSQAHVSWYASSLTSLMPCDNLSPFLEEYKLRFNKKNKGPYKEAVKLATLEAKKESHPQDPLASPTHILPTMSPRPINVFS